MLTYVLSIFLIPTAMQFPQMFRAVSQPSFLLLEEVSHHFGSMCKGVVVLESRTRTLGLTKCLLNEVDGLIPIKLSKQRSLDVILEGRGGGFCRGAENYPTPLPDLMSLSVSQRQWNPHGWPSKLEVKFMKVPWQLWTAKRVQLKVSFFAWGDVSAWV